jgi:hypothetical protein
MPTLEASIPMKVPSDTPAAPGDFESLEKRSGRSSPVPGVFNEQTVGRRGPVLRRMRAEAVASL